MNSSGLSLTGPERPTARFVKFSRRHVRKAFKALMRSYKFKLPKYDLPLRMRPWFVVLTFVVMLILGLLGFTNIPHQLPVNDKLLHFFCLGIATAVFYFIFDVEEDARRIWIWRCAPMILTGFVCFLLGGIVSEFVQSLLPYKEFQFGDVVANLLGSGIGLYTSYNLERYYRHRREINRLYRPLSGSGSSINLASDDDFSDDEFGRYESGSQLLPLHSSQVRLPPTPKTPASGNGKAFAVGNGKARRDVTLMDAWDEREELFGVGDESDEEVEGQGPSHSSKVPPTQTSSSAAAGKQPSNPRRVRFEEEEDEDDSPA